MDIRVISPSEKAVADCERHWDSIAKPLGSLGKLENIVARIAGIRGSAQIDGLKKCVLVFCADNGVVAEGVAQTDSSATAAVAESIAQGTANVNAMARVAGADVFAIDMGMNARVPHPAMIDRRIADGTKNITAGPAMTRKQAEDAVRAGMNLVFDMKARGYDIIATGEMGIGNTTTSAAVAAVLLGRDAEEVTGRGAGLSDAGLIRKRTAIKRAIETNRPNPNDAMDVLAKLGGFDIAGMAGAFLGGASHGVPIVIDGFISGVAALIAYRIAPGAREFMFASHASREPAGQAVLDALGLSPILRADMALGEGTGAVAHFPLIDMALSVYNSNHTFAQIHMDAYERPKGDA